VVIQQLTLRKFRNIEDEVVTFESGVNIICGDNAQGKTNIVEAVGLFSHGKSFRAVREKEMIYTHSDSAVLAAKYIRHGRKHTAEIKLYRGAKKECYTDGVKLEKNSQLIGGMLCVVFSPEHLNLIKEGPRERRRFLDMAVSQISPKYFRALSSYGKILANRNSLLKMLRSNPRCIDTLDAWDEKLCEYGAYIIYKRAEMTKRLAQSAAEAHKGISKGAEILEVSYLSECLRGSERVDMTEISKQMKHLLDIRREDDIRRAVTSAGPHRDDLGVVINGLSARLYGSQGQQRSCVLSLKIAEAELIAAVEGEPPIMLLDDVLSELDENRQAFLMEKIEGMQVIITTCDQEPRIGESARRMKVEKGKIVRH